MSLCSRLASPAIHYALTTKIHSCLFVCLVSLGKNNSCQGRPFSNTHIFYKNIKIWPALSVLIFCRNFSKKIFFFFIKFSIYILIFSQLLFFDMLIFSHTIVDPFIRGRNLIGKACNTVCIIKNKQNILMTCILVVLWDWDIDPRLYSYKVGKQWHLLYKRCDTFLFFLVFFSVGMFLVLFLFFVQFQCSVLIKMFLYNSQVALRVWKCQYVGYVYSLVK